MPWNIPREMDIFRIMTKGNPVIMGRRTHESIGKILPNRTNIVITRNADYVSEGAIVCNDLESAVEAGNELSRNVFVIGGEEIYRQALPISDWVLLSILDKDYDGDTFFPEFESEFSMRWSAKYPEDGFCFNGYKRK